MPMRKHLVKIARAFCLSLLGLFLLLSLWQTVARVLFRQNPPYIFGYAPLTVLSGSMEPAFSAGDLVVIHREEAYAVGDVITYRNGSALITHRLIGDGPEGVTTKGDFNDTPDLEPVAVKQIVGRVVLVIPALGRVLLFLRTPAGLLTLLGCAMLLLVLPCGWRWLRNGRKRGAV